MNKNLDRKREYVQITSKIMENEGIKNVNIRRIAKCAGCTSAVLYKHFDNLEHLITLASVKFLEPYIIEFQKMAKRKDLSPVQVDLYLWKFFIKEAFKNRPYYEAMFFGRDGYNLEYYIYEYYTLFPEIEKDFDGFSASIIFSNNITEREYIRLRRAAHYNLISMDNAKVLSRLTTAVFKGIFVQYNFENQDENDINSAVDECYNLIYCLFEKFVNEGTDLSIDNI